MSAEPPAFAPVAVTTRSGTGESAHFGAVVVVGPDGEAVWSVGDPDVEIYPRSSSKPMQADAMLRAGWRGSDEQVALACASHAGTPGHLAVVESTLTDAGLGPEALRNTPALPLDVASAHDVLARGGSESPLTMNCSGKHAAMLATCVAAGWPIADYLDADHPLQRAITTRIDALAGPVSHIGVDGCGAPAHVVSLSGLARGFGRLAAERGVVWSAMTARPDLVGGEGRDVTRIMQLVPGLMAKDGAEGVFAAGLPDGRGAAVKIADGNSRASGIVLAAALAAAGVDVDPTRLGAPILGHGEPVGEVCAIVGVP